MENSEIWINASSLGFGNYSVSNYGKIMNRETSYIFNNKPRENGYISIQLRDNNEKRVTTYVHILVASLFIPNPENKPSVDHIDKNRSNNIVTNLCWATYREQNMNRSNKKHRQGRNIDQYTINGEYIKTWRSIKSVADVFGCNPTNLKHTLAGKRNSWHNYTWAYADDDLPGEIWKLVPFKISHIYASNFGRLKRVGLNGRMIYGSEEGGYIRVGMRINGKIVKFSAHQLICLAFHGLPPDEERIYVNHINGVKNDNYSENLEWVNNSENLQHAHDNELVSLSSMSKPVLQYTLDGTFIKKYNSIAEVIRECHYQRGGWTSAMNNNSGIYGGFLWKFEDKTQPNIKPIQLKQKIVLKSNIKPKIQLKQKIKLKVNIKPKIQLKRKIALIENTEFRIKNT